MDKFKEIRPIVLGIARKNDKILVQECFDEKENKLFYRALGGGIEFCEKSQEALKREFLEELGIEIEVGEYLGISENIFEYNGRRGHELVLMYNVIIKDEEYKESYTISDDNGKALWIDIEDFIQNKRILYPKEIFEYLM